jgi:hypothetical protein
MEKTKVNTLSLPENTAVPKKESPRWLSKSPRWEANSPRWGMSNTLDGWTSLEVSNSWQKNPASSINTFPNICYWKDLCDENKLNDPIDLKGNFSSDIDNIINIGVPLLSIKEKEVLVFFGCGTFVICNSENIQFEFDKFTNQKDYSVPIHCLDKGKAEGRQLLIDAQARLDIFEKQFPDDIQYIKYSLGEMAKVKYLDPDNAGSDAIIRSLWRKSIGKSKFEWLALVRLRAFAGTGIGILTGSIGDTEIVSKDLIKFLAYDAWERYCRDYLCPTIKIIFV